MIEIKEVFANNFDEIWPIFKEVAAAAETYPYPPNITKDEAKAQWFAPYAKVFNAYKNDRLIATRYIVPNKTGLGSHVCNMGVMVDKVYRGTGIGHTMLEFGINKASEWVIKRSSLIW